MSRYIAQPGVVVMGIDSAMNHTGIVVLRDQTVIYDTPIKSRGSRGSARIEGAQEQLTEVLNEYRPALIALEDYAYGAENQAHQIGEFTGALKLVAWQMGFDVLTVPVLRLKKYAANYGKAQKNQMLRNVFKRWAYDAVTDNEADACGLAYLAAEYHAGDYTKRFVDLMTSDKKRMVKKVRVKYKEFATPILGRGND